MAQNFQHNPADLLTLCVDAMWQCAADLRLDCLRSIKGHALAAEVSELRGRRLSDLAKKAIYAGQRDALLARIATREAFRDLTLSLMNSHGKVQNYMLNAAPQLDAQGQFKGYVGSLRIWKVVPFSEHRQGEIVELLRRADSALDKESRLRHEADVLLAALQVMIEPKMLQEKCAKLFDIFGPIMAFDTALVLRRGLRARFTVVASSNAQFLGTEWPASATPKDVLTGQARLIEGGALIALGQSLPNPLRPSKAALFAPLCIGTETAVLVLFTNGEKHFTTQHLSLMQRISLIAVKAFQEEDQKTALVSSSKLAAMGELLATIIHEINQPLTIISMSASNARLFIEDGGETSDVDAKLERIELQARRAAEIVKALRELSYSDRLSSGHGTIILRESLEAVETIARIGLERKNITLTVEISDACPHVHGQSSWLQQVLLNLITNASDAISDNLGGDLSEVKGAVRVDAYPDGEYVIIRVADNGGGIPEDMQQKVFDPFFTLKEMGKGTGLGLALCQRLISDMDGKIALHNDDHGAVFEIFLRQAVPGMPDTSPDSALIAPGVATG